MRSKSIVYVYDLVDKMFPDVFLTSQEENVKF